MTFENRQNGESPSDLLVSIEKKVFVRDELGLHARPAARLAQAAQQFHSSITLIHEDLVADAKSILDILSLAAGRGAPLILRCEGEDAHVAAAVLTELLSGSKAVDV